MHDGKGLHRSLVLVGCGKMGTAMLRGWLAGDVISQFYIVEPEGMPLGLSPAPEMEWHTTAETLPPGMAPDAVVFAVKPQPRSPLDHCVNRKSNRAREPNPPRRDGDSSREHSAGGAGTH